MKITYLHLLFLFGIAIMEKWIGFHDRNTLNSNPAEAVKINAMQLPQPVYDKLH